MSSLHQRAKDVFIAALDRPEEERAAFVAEACAADVSLKQEVESLLGFHADQDEETPSPNPDARFAPGEMFASRYRMITRIGRGGMGGVWGAGGLVLEESGARTISCCRRLSR